MPAPKSLPKYVYKIIDSAPPSPIPKVFPPSDLDKADGFIHLSTASQIPITASLFFASHTTLWLLKIRYEPISSSSKWDDPPNDNDGCPHLYGSFGAAETESVEKFERTGAEQGWKDVFAASSWLE
ncbi:hypothetical protein N0V93_000629 [Gnomoniopsis smithogilvyi]|uniref:DUF952 domain-containing protein n=1 Tax=Gnomoniopsis smithogilvyi TaxID=1191159 RepID=A0A9W9D1W6_9PEZI|nr:hypothetical protein N0V93_000629 [Gnomoniopsis smithogilvyi]